MKRTWVQINEEILELEREKIRDNKWIDKWNKLIDETKKVAGCLKREKYDKKNIRETSSEKEKEEGIDINNA